MKRGVAFVLLGMIGVAGGCASPAHYVEQKGDSGVVAIPDNSNAWPNYNMRAAKELMAKHVGPNYEIVDQYQVKTGQTTRNDQQTNTELTPNRRNPNLPGEHQTTTGVTTTQDTTEWRIVYRRVAAPVNYDQPYGGVPGTGLAPAGGTTAQGPPVGTVPSVLPAGGTVPVSRGSGSGGIR